MMKKLSAAIVLQGERHRCLPATMAVIDDHHIHLSIGEGKYYQTERMMAALVGKMVGLHSFQAGDMVLNPQLQLGDYRPAEAACVLRL